jgi:hypothetical protein
MWEMAMRSPLIDVLSALFSRRSLLPSLSAAALGLFLSLRPTLDLAKQKHRKRKTKKPPAPNDFGCLDVGQPCREDIAPCCSGLCAVVKAKKKKKARLTCVAHHADTCKADRNYCSSQVFEEFTCGPLDQFGNPDAVCLKTTGSAGFCADNYGFSQTKHCLFCRKDADCVVAGFPPGSACVLLQGGDCDAACPATNGRSCFPPGVAG